MDSIERFIREPRAKDVREGSTTNVSLIGGKANKHKLIIKFK